MRIAFTTLGCKINQFETDVMRQDFLSRGSTIVPFEAEADVYVINTCSVTAKSDYRCRQVIRAAVQRANGAQVVVTGCYAATRPAEIRRIKGVNYVFGNLDKTRIPEQIMLSQFPSPVEVQNSRIIAPKKLLQSRTRGFLKIQDGCDNRCSYCIVPLARGRSRSSPVAEVIRQFDGLVLAGHGEIVLTGIHIGTYGNDLVERTDLTSLINMLIARRAGTRIRLSSIEPREIKDDLIRLLGLGLCRHLHIPLQSGDDAILGSMKRDYSSQSYLGLLERISEQVPGIALGTDVMVGYPGEGDAEFNNTVRLIEKSPLTHLHVFSYSRRPQTSAADMKDQVPDPVKKERNEALRKLGRDKNLAFGLTQIGIELKAVVEDRLDEQSGMLSGLTDNYLRVYISGARTEHIGKKIGISIKEVKSEGIYAVIL